MWVYLFSYTHYFWRCTYALLLHFAIAKLDSSVVILRTAHLLLAHWLVAPWTVSLLKNIFWSISCMTCYLFSSAAKDCAPTVKLIMIGVLQMMERVINALHLVWFVIVHCVFTYCTYIYVTGPEKTGLIYM